MNDEEPQHEDFAQVLADLMADYEVNGTQVAEAIGVSTSTVNTWLHRKRTPRPEAIAKLAGRYPRYSVKRLSDAAGRKAPGPVSPDRAQRLLEIFEGLTEEQQEIMEIQARALRESNR
ncbi:helix-turn-helix domain-containing protein [Streptomyces sp. NPDC016845]|uniref:helix-turn-helix domain-containing protein n=1 Tax=Streptomyces sp. NPDC016845 TaxID=3364972 RepID=UPI0037A0FADF